jgi:4-carboxymuconolactone decarboxylase
MAVLRTLSGGDAGRAFAGLQRRYPEMAGDVVSAIDMAWTGPALDRKTRSLQVVAMLGALGGRSGPLRSHINGALNHGATPEQLVETMKMVAVYGGFPAALEAWPVMEAVFAERGIPRPGGL